MIGLMFMGIIGAAAIGSKLCSDIGEHKNLRKRQKNWNVNDDPTAVFHTLRNGDVDLMTGMPVVVSRNESGHIIKKYKNGMTEDVTMKQYRVASKEKLMEALEKAKDNPDIKYVKYDWWDKRTTQKEGVYGEIYADRNDVTKRYVRRFFEVIYDDIYSKYNLYYPHQHKKDPIFKTTGLCKNCLRFDCLMDVESGELIGVTEECNKLLKEKENKYEDIIRTIDMFVNIFNEAQGRTGFINEYNSRERGFYSDKEAFYCSGEEYLHYA